MGHCWKLPLFQTVGRWNWKNYFATKNVPLCFFSNSLFNLIPLSIIYERTTVFLTNEIESYLILISDSEENIGIFFQIRLYFCVIFQFRFWFYSPSHRLRLSIGFLSLPKICKSSIHWIPITSCSIKGELFQRRVSVKWSKLVKIIHSEF